MPAGWLLKAHLFFDLPITDFIVLLQFFSMVMLKKDKICSYFS